MINWSKVDWVDVGIHIGMALAISGLFIWIFGIVGAWVGFIVNLAFWYEWESSQHIERGPNPLNWGWGSQMEFYSPVLTSLLLAIIWTLVSI